MTPDLALDRLKQGHHRFLAGKSTVQDYQKQIAITGTGQYPIRSKSAILKEMERKGEIKIVPAMYDIKTGKVEFL